MRKNFNNIYIIVIAGNLLALTGDTTITWSSPVLPILYSNNTEINPLGRPLTETEASWIGSILYIGAIIGIIPAGLLSDKIGRKVTLILLGIPHVVAYLIFACSNNLMAYYMGRLLCGVSLSAVYVVLPMYVAEISEDKHRGKMLVSYTTFASFGMLLPHIAGPYLSMFWINILISLFPISFLCLFTVFAVESPYYLLQKNEEDRAIESLKTLRSTKNNYSKHEESNKIGEIFDTIKIIREEIFQDPSETEHQQTMINYLKSKHVRKGFIVALGLCCFQQLSGISAILGYTEIIFLEANTDVSPEVASIITGIFFFVASFLSPFVVDRKGRKFLLILSASGIILSEMLLGVYFYVEDYTDLDLSAVSWLPIICLLVYMASYNIGFGPLPFTIAAEILPSHVKFLVVTVAGTGCWLVSFLVDRFFLDLDSTWGRGETFFLFMIFTVASLVFVVFYVPETRGKSFKEIQESLER